jgi:hypothetical protein
MSSNEMRRGILRRDARQNDACLLCEVAAENHSDFDETLQRNVIEDDLKGEALGRGRLV